MGKSLRRLALLLMGGIFSLTAVAQSSVLSGTVKDQNTKEPIPSVTVSVTGSTGGGVTDDKGVFKLTTSQKPPFTLSFSSVGFKTKELAVTSLTQSLDIELEPGYFLGEELVVSASRTSERILESPVTIERVSAAAIRSSPAANFYDIIGNLKGIDITTSSLNFKTPSTRGFVGSGNLRFNQLVDGMDNQAPGLNFSLGGFIGLSELDVDNIELLPGASSALYGPGGMNGTLLINSKNPFKYQGVSFIVKEGLMNADSKFRKASLYSNWTLRWAEKISDKFAFKFTTELVQAKDWYAADYRNYKRTATNSMVGPGNRETDPNYDGVNIYGDETTGDIRGVLTAIQAQVPPPTANYIAGLLGTPINVSRTGYAEKDVVDPNTVNYKISGALHYKVTPGIEAILQGNWGTGNTVYTGSDRYSLRDLKMGQYKLELNHENWFVRAYTTQENAGQSFNATVTTRLLNEAWKQSAPATGDPTQGWFFQYGAAYLASKMAGLSEAESHAAARATADVGRPAPGSAQFKTLFDKVRTVPISKGGGLFVDKTNLYNIEGQYNLSSWTRGVADLIVGGNYKRYVLNSEGTLFADSAGKIGINEVGFYGQANRTVLNNKLKLTLSGRYDKNQNFKGRFTPRATAVIKVGTTSNIRLSYQTAYRFPSTQQQWINLAVGGGVQLIGGNKGFQQDFSKYPVFDLITGAAVTFPDFKPESVRSYEVGFKSLVGKNLLIDFYGYWGKYKDFIVRRFVSQPLKTRILSVPTNTATKVETYGAGLSLDYKLPGGFLLGGNISTDALDKVPPGFVSFFNSPRYRTNLTITNNGFGPKKVFGFSVVYKWQDSFYYEGDFANGDVPKINTVDAQISFKLPKKSVVKFGANNLLNQYYTNAFGNPYIGGLYYVSYGYNVF